MVIVGAGPGGLTAGAYLAQHGLKVVIFDHHYVAGGCATMFTRGPQSDRYAFDVGLHYIGDCGPDGRIPGILKGLDLSLDFREMDPDGFDTLVFPDLEFKVPTAWRCIKRLNATSSKEGMLGTCVYPGCPYGRQALGVIRRSGHVWHPDEGASKITEPKAFLDKTHDRDCGPLFWVKAATMACLPAG